MMTSNLPGVDRYDGNRHRSLGGRAVWYERERDRVRDCERAYETILSQLQSHLEETPYAFVTMSVLSAAIALLVASVGLRRYSTLASHVIPTLMLCVFPDCNRSAK